MQKSKNRWIAAAVAIFMLSGIGNAYAGQVQDPLAALMAPAKKPEPVYICSMGHELAHGKSHSNKPGFCDKCGMELVDKTAQLRVAVLVFDDVEVIDFAGPMEVFGQSGASQFTVAASMHPIRTVAGLKLQPDYDFEHAPAADVVLIPGGGVMSVTKNPKLLAWIRQRRTDTRIVMSVCTGAFILGRAGLLDGIPATTIAGMQDQLGLMFPKTKVVRDQRYVDNGVIITTGGLSAGIDGALHVIDREFGRLTAEEVARGLEYRWSPDSSSEFGDLAKTRIPPITSIFPVEASWKKLQDNGDAQHWTLAGHLEIPMSTKDFFAGSTKRIREKNWTLTQSSALQRSFVKKDATGQNWLLKLNLVAETKVPPSYHLTIDIEKKLAK